MSESPNTALEALKIITNFLSDNSLTIVLLVLLIICRTAISDFISRLYSFSYKDGDKKLGMEAAPPTEEKEKTHELRSVDKKPSPEEESPKIELKGKAWFYDMHKAFGEGRLNDAEASFKKYALDENDEIELEKNKALYLYLRFEECQDNLAIGELKDLARTAKNDDSKFSILRWLSYCFNSGMQYKEEIGLWRAAIKDIKSEPFKTNAIVNLAYALNNEGPSIEAKKLLVSHLSAAEADTQKATLYEALSIIEFSLGNKQISIYCKDKSLEFDVNNRDKLFSSAYEAGNENIDEISISNYTKLIRIDANNSTALNNLGVLASEAGLKIKAVDSYKRASDKNNTLAMANQGYFLLESGFADEAEKIAKEALAQEDPHKNVHSLLTAIDERKETQNKEWKELSKKSLEKQKIIRIFTEQYYFGNPKSLEGDWLASSVYPTTITLEDELINITWIDSAPSLAGGEYIVRLVGEVTGSTISCKYTRERTTNSPSTLLGIAGNTSKQCMGYISVRTGKIELYSTKLEDDFFLCLSRPNN